ncbi:MAG: universal stress protein [Burkholderiaceae bacterium]|nr:universal stress protein [Burkholderiaceae bacterium]MDZ4145905.1 universal stress protein [Burkholderiales bacterium]
MHASHALRNILVATDLSSPARHAARRAAQVASASRASLTVIHVAGGSVLGELQRWLGQDSATETALLETAQHTLQTLSESLGGHMVQPVHQEVARGPVVDRIIDVANRVAAGLIVIGAHGTGYLRRLALGSTAERLLRRSRRPVLVVRQTPHEPYQRVLVPVDFSSSTNAAIELARQVAPDTPLVLLHVWSVPYEGKLRFAGVSQLTIDHYRRSAREEALQKMHQLADSHQLAVDEWTPCVMEGDVTLQISEQEQEHDCDLVVIGKHGHHFVEELLLGSVTQRVLADAQCDVLVTPSSLDE